MATGGHFGCPKITFDHSSCHFRSIRNFFFFWNFWTKWPPAAILDWTTMSVIELVRDIWMNNACVKFEERSLNPSKVIALTTKLCGGRRRRCGGGGGCVAVENIISPKTYVSREYNYREDMNCSRIANRLLRDQKSLEHCSTIMIHCCVIYFSHSIQVNHFVPWYGWLLQDIVRISFLYL